MDCKFLTSQLLLINNIWTNYHVTVTEKHWTEFYAAFNNNKKTILRTIETDNGPIRRKRTKRALQQLQGALLDKLIETEKQNAA